MNEMANIGDVRSAGCISADEILCGEHGDIRND